MKLPFHFVTSFLSVFRVVTSITKPNKKQQPSIYSFNFYYFSYFVFFRTTRSKNLSLLHDIYNENNKMHKCIRKIVWISEIFVLNYVGTYNAFLLLLFSLSTPSLSLSLAASILCFICPKHSFFHRFINIVLLYHSLSLISLSFYILFSFYASTKYSAIILIGSLIDTYLSNV